MVWIAAAGPHTCVNTCCELIHACVPGVWIVCSIVAGRGGDGCSLGSPLLGVDFGRVLTALEVSVLAESVAAAFTTSRSCHGLLLLGSSVMIAATKTLALCLEDPTGALGAENVWGWTSCR